MTDARQTFIIDPLDPRELSIDEARAVWEQLPTHLREATS